jgi:hypothetical protein
MTDPALHGHDPALHGHDPHRSQAAAPSELTQALLDVLRNVNREVKTTLALDGKAAAAVAHFQAIAASLRTLADGSPASSTKGAGAPSRL